MRARARSGSRGRLNGERRHNGRTWRCPAQLPPRTATGPARPPPLPCPQTLRRLPRGSLVVASGCRGRGEERESDSRLSAGVGSSKFWPPVTALLRDPPPKSCCGHQRMGVPRPRKFNTRYSKTFSLADKNAAARPNKRHGSYTLKCFETSEIAIVLSDISC